MENLDGTIVTTAAPAIGADLGVDSASVGLAITAYLLAVAVLIPVSGWLSDRFGVRRIFILAIAVFTTASVLCALSTSLPMLVGMRILQGVGGALMVPVGRTAVLRVTPTSGIISAFAILVWPGLVAPILAPFVGGLLTTYASWHWIFLINVPLGIIAMLIALRIVTDVEPATARSLDGAGFAYVLVGLGALVYGSSRIGVSETDWVGFCVASAMGLLVCGLAVRHLLRARHPLLQLRDFRLETFRVANSSGSVYRATINAVPFLLPLMFQDAFGWSPVQAGAVVLWLFVGNLAIKPATTWLLRTFGFRFVIVVSNAVGIACMIGMATLSASSSLLLIVPLLVASGAARSAGLTAYATITYAEIDASGRSAANTLVSTLQQVSVGFGVALAGIALAVGFAIGDGLLPYHFAFLIIAAITLLPLVAALRLSKNAGSALTA